MIEALLKAGADLNAREYLGNTPLHKAASYNRNPAVIEALVKGGARLEARNLNGNKPLHFAAGSTKSPDVVLALLEADPDPMARNAEGKTPWDLAQDNEEFKGSDAYWRLNDARFERRGQGARRVPKTTPEPAGNEEVPAGGTGCQVPGYPNPPGGVANLGVSWCPASVDLQVRAFALQAAGAQCAISTGSSSTPEQIEARRREIREACGRLGALGQGNCQCPPGLGQ